MWLMLGRAVDQLLRRRKSRCSINLSRTAAAPWFSAAGRAFENAAAAGELEPVLWSGETRERSSPG